MKAIDVANELQKVVDGLRENPDAEVPRAHLLFTGCGPEGFKRLAQAAPRPLRKKVAYEGTNHAELAVEYESNTLWLRISAPQSETCRLVSPAVPAKYECDPELEAELVQ